MKHVLLPHDTIRVHGATLRRIQRVSDGTKGGYVEAEENLSQEGHCWLHRHAQAFGQARVTEDAQVHGQVCEQAAVSDRAIVQGQVYGRARVTDDARVEGKVHGDAIVRGHARAGRGLRPCPGRGAHRRPGSHLRRRADCPAWRRPGGGNRCRGRLSMTSHAFIAHQLPRRTRVLVPTKQGNQRFFEGLASHLADCPEVRHVRINSIAASAAIEHAEGGFDQVASFAAQDGLFEMMPGLPRGCASVSEGSGYGLPSALSWVLKGAALYGADEVRHLGGSFQGLHETSSVPLASDMPRLAALLLGAGLAHLATGGVLGAVATLLRCAVNGRELMGAGRDGDAGWRARAEPVPSPPRAALMVGMPNRTGARA